MHGSIRRAVCYTKSQFQMGFATRCPRKEMFCQRGQIEDDIQFLQKRRSLQKSSRNGSTPNEIFLWSSFADEDISFCLRFTLILELALTRRITVP